MIGLKKSVRRIFCFISMMFLLYTSVCMANYETGIISDSKLLYTIRYNIDREALHELYAMKANMYIDFKEVYAIIKDDIYKMDYVIPIFSDRTKNKVIGEIKSNLTILEKDKGIDSLTFIMSDYKERCDVKLLLKEVVAKFFIFGSTSYSKYIPSILKSKKTIVKKLDNTGYHYLPLKDKVD